MVSSAALSTVNVAVHRASVLPDGQLEPVAAEVTTVDTDLLPVSGLFTVTEKVTVAESPGFRLPVQVRAGLANDTDPAVADAPPL